MDEPRRAEDRQSSPGPGDDETAMNVSRQLALTRQKDELRRERDRLLFDLARGLGRERMAQAFGLNDQDVGRLLDRARRRMDPMPPDTDGSGAQITVRRLRARERSGLRAAAPKGELQGRGRPEQAHPGPAGPPSVLGRHRAQDRRGPERWAQADSHYEALGLESPDDR